MVYEITVNSETHIIKAYLLVLLWTPLDERQSGKSLGQIHGQNLAFLMDSKSLHTPVKSKIFCDKSGHTFFCLLQHTYNVQLRQVMKNSCQRLENCVLR